MLLNTLLGLIVFSATNMSLLYTSHLLVRRFFPDAPHSVRLVAIGLLFYSFILLIFQGLSPFHAITKIGVVFSCLLLVLVSHLLWGKERNIEADIVPIKSWIRDGLASRWAALLIICGFVVLLSLSRALLMPPLAWDCLTYHLTFAALWVKKGTLLHFSAPDQIHICAHLPINGEIFASWFLLPFHNDLLVNTMNFPITLLGGISCYAISRELGLTRKEASFTPVLICFSPVIYTYITTQYVEIQTFAFCSASVLFALRYLREGYLHDGFLALVAAGILLGTKFTGIPLVGLIFAAIALKTIFQARHTGLFKKLILILLGFIFLCVLGGRQYICNAIEAANPLYPLPIKLFDREITKGWAKVEQANKFVCQFEKDVGWDKFSWWEREYRKFCYKPFRWWDREPRKSDYPPLAAGPKFLLFLVLACISLFTRPRHVSKRCWYFLSMLWIVPIILFYADTSANAARGGFWTDESIRFLSPSLAILTTQGLVVIQKFRKYCRGVDFFLVALVAWDLLYINKTHLWEVELLYPFLVLTIPLVITLFNFMRGESQSFALQEEALTSLTRLPRRHTTIKLWVTFTIGFIFLVGGFYLLQSYRDNTRYLYYRRHLDLHYLTRAFVNGWEFLDQHDGKKTIAMTMDWEPPGHKWFYYPLLGKWLQNDIAYISAKHKQEVPTRIHRGLLRGDDFSIWLRNLKRENVDYILVQKPWPIELRWMLYYKEKFQLVFIDNNCRIFKYTGKKT